ncbi:MAG: hypothetical protein NT085_01540 [candidate division SR1 bacterium]|nr:hypothetical protein [candidate division SR1 bacterium]
MLFDFQAFIEELREKPEKKQIVEKYESLFGPIQGDIKDQIWYTEYLIKFEALPYETPEELKNDFDRDLLEQLVIGSFSSDYELKKEEKKDEKELYIAVKSGEQSVVKTVSELRSFQILRLYEIYIEEQMNLHALKAEDENEKNTIDQEREMRLKRWEAVRQTIDRDELSQKAKSEQAGKMEDLMGKL